MESRNGSHQLPRAPTRTVSSVRIRDYPRPIDTGERGTVASRLISKRRFRSVPGRFSYGRRSDRRALQVATRFRLRASHSPSATVGCRRAHARWSSPLATGFAEALAASDVGCLSSCVSIRRVVATGPYRRGCHDPISYGVPPAAGVARTRHTRTTGLNFLPSFCSSHHILTSLVTSASSSERV